jgi:hypothetical protein
VIANDGPAPLGEQQRRELLWQLGRALAAQVAPGWREVRVRYQAAGRHIEVDMLVTGPDGPAHPDRPSPDVVGMLGNLRSGMYEQGRGTWLVAELVLRPGADLPEPAFGYDQEPHWRRVPPPIGCRDELTTFPRDDEHIPAWLRQRLNAQDPAAPPAPDEPASALDMATPTQPGPPRRPGQPGTPGHSGGPGAPSHPGGPGNPGTPGHSGGPGPSGAPSHSAAPGQPGRPGQHSGGRASAPQPSSGRAHIRTPRVHDGFDREGRPVVRRMPLSQEDREKVLGYLDGAPVVLAARGYGEDAFDPESAPNVPMTFRTDGFWVWPGAVAYYLRVHSISPDPDLVEHIRTRQFVVPDVDEQAKQVALAAVTGGDDLLDD